MWMYKLDRPETCNLSLGEEMAQRLLLRLWDMHAELRSGNMGFTYKDFPAISETPQPPPTTHKSWSISSFLLEAGGRRDLRRCHLHARDFGAPGICGT